MHEDLVPRLRELADDGYLLHTSTGEALREAADAIEELTVMLDAANDEATALYGALPRWIRVEEAQPTSQGPFFTRYGFGAASRETGQYFSAPDTIFSQTWSRTGKMNLWAWRSPTGCRSRPCRRRPP